MVNWSWYPSGGDWSYIKSICDLYEKKNHHIIPFSVKNEKNYPTPYTRYFLNSINYKTLYDKITIKSGLYTAIKSIYSIEAKHKLQLLLNENKVDIAQFNNITNYHTPSIIPVLQKVKVPIVWRILDYRLICPNSTFLSNGHLCEACFKRKYYKCALKRCKKNSFMASALIMLENYFYFLLPHYKNVDMFLFQSEFTRDIFVKFGFDIKKTHIIENPYDYLGIKPLYEGNNYILYFGRLSKEKGVLTLLKAMKKLPDIQLKVVGDGPEQDFYNHYAIENSLTNVSFLGPKWGIELDPIIRHCEFVIVPSEWYEPSPYTVLQSFAYGKAVVGSDIGGLKDLIINNENGLLFKTGDIDNLSQVIMHLMPDKYLIRKMGENARIILEKKHDSERYYAKTMNIFTEIINKKSRI
ncbi:MAG: glycosyltransferase family 4 protein [Negativicutes bacterium]|nr:glycosyltransferase family 4 protein [Negativicutes bacterium]